MIDQATIIRIKELADLTEVVGDYVPLNKYRKGPCPFHAEKTPSFVVSGRRKTWKCFGCGAGGDVFDFIQRINKLSFSDAVRWLADKVGVAVAQSKQETAALNRKWALKQEELRKIDYIKEAFHAAFIYDGDKLLKQRRNIHTKPIEEWDSNDYLSEQLVDYQFDHLSVFSQKIDRMISSRRRELINA